MTVNEAKAAILAIVPTLPPADLEGFLSCSDEERAALIQAYKDAGVVASASTWDAILAVLKECAALVGLVSPIGSAVSIVFGLVGAAKSL